MRVLITGAAGFIGYHTAAEFLKNHDVIGIDNLHPDYESGVREERLKKLFAIDGFTFINQDVLDSITVDFDVVVHLASLCGVRESTDNPGKYIRNNIEGMANVLRYCEDRPLIYASSASVYGEEEPSLSSTPRPKSVYGITKHTCEQLASISSVRSVGMRFFNVYGPTGRASTFIPKVIQACYEGELDLYNYGKNIRAFTYVGDVAGHIVKTLEHMPSDKIQNVCSTETHSLNEVVDILSGKIGNKPKINYLPPKDEDIQVSRPVETILQDPVSFSEGIDRTL